MTSQQQPGQAADTTMSDRDAPMTLAEWRAQCPWLDKPDHEPTACFHCATDDELSDALAVTPARNSPGHGNGDQ